MVEEIQGAREVHPAYPDFVEASHKGITLPHDIEVTEREISVFCGGCDHLKPDNTCTSFDDNDQGVHAFIQNCNLATVGTNDGKMTAEGFVAWKK